VAVSEVNVRSGPDTTFDIQLLLSAGTVATVIEVDDPANPLWVHVLLDDGSDGWVSIEFIEPVF
jgi:uncharacterized protein YgiM (DUF1202 family)